MSLRSLAAGGVIGAVIATAVGIAYASIPDSSGVIHACYQNVSGANKPVKLLNTSQATTCPSGWKPVSWNQTGVQGPPGPAGATIVAKLRSSAPTTIDANATNIPMPGWTQPAGEDDLIQFLSATITTPSTCTESGTPWPPSIQGTISIDGSTSFGSNKNFHIYSENAPLGTTTTVSVIDNAGESQPYPALFEPATATPHTVNVQISGSCDQSFTVDSFAIDVIGFK